jgi:multidrug resistance efflux pump
VFEVLVDEGQPVSEGDPLVRLDARLLEVQRESARAGGEAAVAAARLQQIQAQQALDDLFTNAPMAAAQAELALADAGYLDDARITPSIRQGTGRPRQ